MLIFAKEMVLKKVNIHQMIMSIKPKFIHY